MISLFLTINFNSFLNIDFLQTKVSGKRQRKVDLAYFFEETNFVKMFADVLSIFITRIKIFKKRKSWINFLTFNVRGNILNYNS